MGLLRKLASYFCGPRDSKAIPGTVLLHTIGPRGYVLVDVEVPVDVSEGSFEYLNSKGILYGVWLADGPIYLQAMGTWEAWAEAFLRMWMAEPWMFEGPLGTVEANVPGFERPRTWDMDASRVMRAKIESFQLMSDLTERLNRDFAVELRVTDGGGGDT